MLTRLPNTSSRTGKATPLAELCLCKHNSANASTETGKVQSLTGITLQSLPEKAKESPTYSQANQALGLREALRHRPAPSGGTGKGGTRTLDPGIMRKSNNIRDL